MQSGYSRVRLPIEVQYSGFPDTKFRIPVCRLQSKTTARDHRRDHHDVSENSKLQGRRAMISEWGDCKARVQDVNTICMRLFDRWCECRNLTPLAYLMHCWPLLDSRADTIRRLQESMKDLRRNHADKLDLYALSALGELARSLDELIDRAETSPGHSFAT